MPCWVHQSLTKWLLITLCSPLRFRDRCCSGVVSPGVLSCFNPQQHKISPRPFKLTSIERGWITFRCAHFSLMMLLWGNCTYRNCQGRGGENIHICGGNTITRSIMIFEFTAVMREEITASSGWFLFQVCVDHSSATGSTSGYPHLRLHTFEAARNCVSGCVIKQLRCTIILCVSKWFSIVHNGDTWLRVTQHSLLDQWRSLRGSEAQEKTTGAYNLQSTSSRAEAAHHGEHRGSYFLPVCAWICVFVCVV